jgi:hypothetical protein
MGILNMIEAMISAAGEIQDFMEWLYATAGGAIWTI